MSGEGEGKEILCRERGWVRVRGGQVRVRGGAGEVERVSSEGEGRSGGR